MLNITLQQNLARLNHSYSLFSSLRQCRNTQIINTSLVQKAIHTSSKRYDLNEFFDNPKNFGVQEVRVGRSWKKEELRLKSNSDLHKLWYVLLKEKNMLLTMEHESKENFIIFPNPERIDKVEDSMENLEDVVRERNVAYFQLETTHTGERPAELIDNVFGLKEVYTKSEYDRPKEVNIEWQKKNPVYSNRTWAVRNFLVKLREKVAKKDYAKMMTRKREVESIFRNFKDVDIEAVKQKYPDIDVDEVRISDKARGNWAP